jgi:hypothetical protein
VEALPFAIAVDFGGLRKPHVDATGGEMDGGILDEGMVSGKLNLGDGMNQVGLESGDLITVREEPSAPFEINGVSRTIPADFVGANPVGLIGLLTEVDLPGFFSVQGAKPFTGHGEILGIERMENEHERRKPQRCSSSGIIDGGGAALEKFLDIQGSWLDFLDGNDVIIFSMLGASDVTGFIDVFVQERFGGGESLHIVDQLLDSAPGVLQYFREITWGLWLNRWNVVVHIGRQPTGIRGAARGGREDIQRRDGGRRLLCECKWRKRRRTEAG